jgi:hypothetical protein
MLSFESYGRKEVSYFREIPAGMPMRRSGTSEQNNRLRMRDLVN